jgi:hypothetical protein
MPKDTGRGLSDRLRRLPSQLLLALINATAVLAIIAAALVLIATARVERLAGNVASTMTNAVLSKLEVDPHTFLADIDRLADNVNTLTLELRTATSQGELRLNEATTELEARVASMQARIESLGEAKSQLIDETIAQFVRALNENLEGFRRCPPRDGSKSAGADGVV